VQIQWTQPYDGAAQITSYTIVIRQSDLLTYAEAKVDCDGTDYDIVANLECFVPISKLIIEPFSLEWGSSIFVRIIATNVIGDSLTSDSGNGAVILTSPDAPYQLADVATITTKH